MYEDRLWELDQHVRSAFSMATALANPRSHLARVLSLLGAETLMVAARHASSVAGAEPRVLTASDFLRLPKVLLQGEKPAGRGLYKDLVDSLVRSQSEHLPGAIADVLLLGPDEVRDNLEAAIKSLAERDVRTPEHAAALLALRDTTATQAQRMAQLPSELSQELGLLPRPTSETDVDELDDEDVRRHGFSMRTDEEDQASREAREWIRLLDQSRAPGDRWAWSMSAIAKEMALAVGDVYTAVTRNLSLLSSLLEQTLPYVSRAVELQSRMFPSDQLVQRFSLAETPSGLAIPLARLGHVRKSLAHAVREVEKSRDALLAMSPSQFEGFMGGLFRHMGFDVEHTALTRDGGADLLCLVHNHGIRFRLAVEVKRYHDRPIDVTLVRSFVGANQQFRAHRLVFVTTSRYTKPAIVYGTQHAHHELELRAYEDIRRWCAEVRMRQGW